MVKAIEEDYQPPSDFKTVAQKEQEAAEKAQKQKARQEAKERKKAAEKAKEDVRERAEKQDKEAVENYLANCSAEEVSRLKEEAYAGGEKMLLERKGPMGVEYRYQLLRDYVLKLLEVQS